VFVNVALDHRLVIDGDFRCEFLCFTWTITEPSWERTGVTTANLTPTVMPFLAPELLNLISDFVIADDDSITLRECSLAFPQITTRFQRALCLKKPAIFSFYPGTDRDPAQQGMFRTLFEILDANPGFGACLPEVRFQFQEKRFLSDPRVHHIARHCTQVVTLVIRFEEGVGWDEFSEANRLALENIIQSPILKTLKLLSVGAAWSTFLHPRPFLESLILEGDYYGTPSNPSSRNDDMPIPTTIENLTGSPKELRCLANALLDGTSRDSFAIDIGRLRTLSTHCRTREVADLRHFLLRADMLETLMLSATYCTPIFFIRGAFFLNKQLSHDAGWALPTATSPVLFEPSTYHPPINYLSGICNILSIGRRTLFLPRQQRPDDYCR